MGIIVNPEGRIFAVGHVPYVLTHDGGGWKHIDIPVTEADISVKMKTIRPLPSGEMVVAGNIGAFLIKDDGDVSPIPVGNELGAPYVAVPFSGEIIIAGTKGVAIKKGDTIELNTWGVTFNPEDIETIEKEGNNKVYNKQVVVGNKMELSYYAVSNGGPWLVINPPSGGYALLGVQPFFEVIKRTYGVWPLEKTFEKVIQGMAVFGEDGFVAVRAEGKWISIDTNTEEEFYDGAYKAGNSVDITDKWVKLFVDIVGVGGHNDIINSQVEYKCTF